MAWPQAMSVIRLGNSNRNLEGALVTAAVGWAAWQPVNNTLMTNNSTSTVVIERRIRFSFDFLLTHKKLNNPPNKFDA